MKPFVQTHHVFGRKFLGVECLKNPIDAWVVQEILWETRPDTIIEVGTYKAGSALYYATLCDALGKGRVITVDLKPQGYAEHPRITQLVGDCQELFPEVARMAIGKRMVILDCCHRADHVLKELDTYGMLVSKGMYLVVEDTVFNDEKHSAGLAMAEWIPKHPEFELDRRREVGELTYNAFGYLRRA